MATYQDHRRHYLGENDRIDHIAEALERPCSVVITPRVIPDGHAPALSPIQEGTSDTSACFSNGSPVCRRASFSHARGNEDAKAQPPLRRTLRKLKGFFSAMLCQRGMEPTTRDIRGPPACRQYRIAPFEERGNWWHGLTFCTESGLVNRELLLSGVRSCVAILQRSSRLPNLLTPTRSLFRFALALSNNVYEEPHGVLTSVLFPCNFLRNFD
mmetsp:Transcript_31544/g.46807  ORF Transcript_31544/g.46807 Transcript_31544/m.46807 type:complete len:213 (+) Transcript_31544:96-734(+)